MDVIAIEDLFDEVICQHLIHSSNFYLEVYPGVLVVIPIV